MRLNISYTAVCNDNMTGKDRKVPVEHSTILMTGKDRKAPVEHLELS